MLSTAIQLTNPYLLLQRLGTSTSYTQTGTQYGSG
jgi:hypothetical protein